jgi:hypothetical protein
MNANEARLLVQALGDRPNVRPRVQPATVVETNFAAGTAVLHMDGDPLGSIVEVNALVAGFQQNDRVMVLFDPPRGAYIVGVIGGGANAGQLLGTASGIGIASVTFGLLGEDFRVVPGRQYRIEMQGYAVLQAVFPGYDPASPPIITLDLEVNGSLVVRHNLFVATTSLPDTVARINWTSTVPDSLLAGNEQMTVEIQYRTNNFFAQVEVEAEIAVLDAGYIPYSGAGST